MNPIEIKIIGMNCGHCVASVEKAVAALAGVEKILVNLEEKKATIWGNSKKEDILQAIIAIGFEAS